MAFFESAPLHVRTLAELKRSASFGAHLCSNSRRSVLPRRLIAPFLRFFSPPQLWKIEIYHNRDGEWMENQRFPTIPHSLRAAYLLLLPVRAERVLFSLMRQSRRRQILLEILYLRRKRIALHLNFIKAMADKYELNEN